MAEVAVRPAVVADLPALAAADDMLIDGSERWAELQDLLRRGWGLLAEDLSDDLPSVIGYVEVAPRHFFGRDFIALLVVADAWRRQGVGTQLLNAATSRTTTNVVFTSTNASNLGMQALLRRENWLVSGSLDGLDDGDPEVVYYSNVLEYTGCFLK